jgi:hypothetical protein
MLDLTLTVCLSVYLSIYLHLRNAHNAAQPINNQQFVRNQVLVYELLTQLVEGGCDKFLLPMLDNVTALVMNGCASSDPKVAEKAMGATSSFIRAFVSKPEVMKFQPVLPHMLQVLKQVLTNGDEDFATHVLEVISQ